MDQGSRGNGIPVRSKPDCRRLRNGLAGAMQEVFLKIYGERKFIGDTQ